MIIELALLLVIFTSLILFYFTVKYRSLYIDEKRKRTSVLVKHGKTMEHLIPWARDFPGDPRKFRFIGDPIDGVLFGEDEIVFLEFKTGSSRLNGAQARVKSLIREKKVKWKEIRV